MTASLVVVFILSVQSQGCGYGALKAKLCKVLHIIPLGIQSPTQLLSHPLRGAIFENWVVSEYLKQQLHRGMRPNLYFWRDSSGLEIDLLHEDAASIKAFEIKSGATFAADWTGNLQKWCDLADMHQEIKTHLIYGGTKNFAFKGSHVSPWHQLPEL